MAIGYSLDALANSIFPVKPNLSANLNTLYGRDNEGKWSQSTISGASIALNYPVATAGVLEVIASNANFAGSSLQRYTTYGDGRVFVRGQNTSNPTDWSEWEEMVRVSRLYKYIYPVGIEVYFANGTNPNDSFPGTTWTQITDGRVTRGATNFVVGAADGNIGQTGGADSVSIAVGNLPVHAHTMAHTHAIQHQHNVPAHAHSMAHTHTMAHTHSTPNHTHSGTANSGGDHSHVIDLDAQGMNSNGSNGYGKITTGYEATEGTFNKFNTNSGGAHTHTVTIPSSGASTTGGSSAANTGGVSTANTGNSAQFATTGGLDVSGGSSAADTGNAGSGSSLGIQNLFRRVGIWRRTS